MQFSSKARLGKLAPITGYDRVVPPKSPLPQRDGLDAQHADDLAYFLCDLVLYDALRLLSTDCGKVFAAVATALAGSAVGSDAALAQCAPSVAAMVRAALTSKAPNVRACKKLMFDYDVLRFGRLGACKRMAANALGKREV